MRKLLICVDLQDQSTHPYQEYFKTTKLDNIDEIYIVHAFQKQIYADNFMVTTYPPTDEYDKIKSTAENFLKEIAKGMIPEQLITKTKFECLLTHTPQKDLVEYADKMQASEMIISTRGLHGIEGLFASSFAEYMIRHAHCPLTVLRNSNI